MSNLIDNAPTNETSSDKIEEGSPIFSGHFITSSSLEPYTNFPSEDVISYVLAGNSLQGYTVTRTELGSGSSGKVFEYAIKSKKGSEEAKFAIKLANDSMQNEIKIGDIVAKGIIKIWEGNNAYLKHHSTNVIFPKYRDSSYTTTISPCGSRTDLSKVSCKNLTGNQRLILMAKCFGAVAVSGKCDVVHRDLKLENCVCYLNPKNHEELTIHIVDWGEGFNKNSQCSDIFFAARYCSSREQYEIKKEYEAAKQKYEQAERKYGQAERKYGEVERKYEAAKQKYEAAKQKYEAAKQKYEEVERKYGEVERKYEAAKQKYEAAKQKYEQDKNTLTQQDKQLQEDNKKLKSKDKRRELENRERELEGLIFDLIGQNQSEKLENQWRDLKGLKKEFEDLQNQLQKLNDLKKKFKDLENQLRKLNDLKKEFKDLENQLQKLNDLKKDMTAIINTTTDVYGLGMMLLKVLFRPDYFDQVAKNYFTAPRRHSDCDGNIRARDGFIANIDKIVDDLARMQNIYTPEQIDGIKHLIKWCMDKDPTKRPTAYQAGALIELLAAECSFEDSKKLAIEDNPTPKNYISEEAREVYEKRGLTASA